jgi:chromosomal replication initiator protein
MHKHGREAAGQNSAVSREERNVGGGQGERGAERGRHEDRKGDGVGGRILERVSREVGAEGYRRYFEHQARVNVDGSRVQVTVPTGFVADLLGRKYGESLRRAAGEELGAERVEVTFRIDRGAFVEGHAPGRAESVKTARVPSGHSKAASPDLSRYRLDDFEVGEANRLAHAAAVALSGRTFVRSSSPLFLHGPCGVGKTHLLRAAAAAVKELGIGSVVYTSAEAFTNDYIMSVQGNTLPAFRSRFRGVALLCIDDVQFLKNKTGTQRELLHTFDAIDLSGARVMLASDEHPRRVQSLSEALVSRFMAGLVVRIDPPEPSLRARIVSRLAASRGLSIDAAGAALISSQCGSGGGAGGAQSVRDIEGVLSRIAAMRALPGHAGSEAGSPVGLVMIRRALGMGEGDSASASRPVRPVRMTLIIEEVCRVLRVEASELFGKGRHKRVVLARSVCAVLGRSLTTMSYPEIARALGRPNHSTVVTAVQRLQGQIAAAETVAPYLGGDLDVLTAELGGLSIEALLQQIRHDIFRASPGL